MLWYTVSCPGREKMEATATGKSIDTPLTHLYQRAGAKLGSWFACALPDDFGNWRSEYDFARKSVALLDKNYRAYLSFTGADRVRYLNAVLTNNIKDLPPSHGIVSLLLNPQGHILAEIETYAHPDRLFCVSYAMIRDSLVQVLDKFIIMDDVTLTDETHLHGTLAVEGPAAASLVSDLTGLDLAKLDELATQDVRVDAIPCSLTRRSPGEFPGAEFLAPRKDMEALWQILAEKACALGGGPVGYTALSAIRLEQGIPWFGYDFGEKQIPHEAGLQDSHISYTKGCYTGQEIVERVRSRGQVNRARVGLLLTGSAVPPANAPLTTAGKEIGYVTRAAFSPALASAIGMGYLRRENAAPGSQFEWSGGAARVARFPDELRAGTH